MLIPFRDLCLLIPHWGMPGTKRHGALWTNWASVTCSASSNPLLIFKPVQTSATMNLSSSNRPKPCQLPERPHISAQGSRLASSLLGSCLDCAWYPPLFMYCPCVWASRHYLGSKPPVGGTASLCPAACETSHVVRGIVGRPLAIPEPSSWALPPLLTHSVTGQITIYLSPALVSLSETWELEPVFCRSHTRTFRKYKVHCRAAGDQSTVLWWGGAEAGPLPLSLGPSAVMRTGLPSPRWGVQGLRLT